MDLPSLGWSGDLAAALAAAGAGLEAGRVALAVHGRCRIWTASGEREAVLSGTLLDAPAHERPVTGDWVGIEPETARIRAVLPRRTCVSRKKAGKATEEQVLAANVDVLCVVMGLDGDFNLRRLERYLVLAEESGCEALVVLNKSDLCGDLAARMREVDRVTQVPVVAMAAVERGSVSQLHRYVEPGRTAALVGSSGVGKSTIVNVLLRESRQATLPVREQDSRGRHATTARELFLLPEGWLLLDTPGMRELEVWTDDGAARSAVFSDIAQFAARCRFRDCRHAGEPGCAVEEAVAQGRLDGARLESYHKLERETDAQVIKRRARILSKAVKKVAHEW
jgi:ribosome biogenesis GTPase